MNINELIKKSAISSSIETGKQIFESGKVLSLSKIGDKNYSAHVAGLKPGTHRLNFSITRHGQLISFCSCSYNSEGICEHLVGALLYMNKNGEYTPANQSLRAQSTEKRDTSIPYKLPKDCMDDLAQLTDHDNFRKAQFRSSSIKDVSIEEDTIIVHVPGEFYYQEVTKVNVRPVGEELYISSFPSKKIEGLSIFEIAALSRLKAEDMSHLFKVFDKEKMEAMMIEKAKKYGFDDISIAKEYFEVNTKDRTYPIQLKEEYRSLLPLSEFRDDFQSFIQATAGGKDSREELLLAQNEKSKDKTPTVVRFSFEVSTIFHKHKIINFFPFVGKVKSDGGFYKTGLQFYKDLNTWDSSQPELKNIEQELILINQKTNKEVLVDRLRSTFGKLSTEEQQKVFLLEKNLSFLRDLLPKLKKAGNVFLHQNEIYSTNAKLDPEGFLSVEIIEETPRTLLEVETVDGFVIATPKLKFSFGTYDLRSSKIKFYNDVFGTIDGKAFLLAPAQRAVVINSAFRELPDMRVIEHDFRGFFGNVIQPLSKFLEVSFKSLPPGFTEAENAPKITAKKVFLRELEEFVLFDPIVEYDKESHNMLDDQPDISLEGDTVVYLSKDKEQENSFLSLVKGMHPEFDKNQSTGFLFLHIDDFVNNYWFLNFFEKLKEQDIEVFGFKDFKNFQYSPHRTTVRVNVESGQDWFDVSIEVLVGDTRISLKDVKKALVSKDKFIKLGDGKLAVLPEEWVEKLQRYLRMGKVEKDGVKISKLKFNAVDKLFEDIDNEEILEEIREKRRKLREFKSIEAKELPQMNAELRSYQKDGYQWLHFLYDFGWGGILADDMGLGKTIQAITLLRFLKTNNVKNNLVVVPTSLLFNWKNELDKFCPSLNYFIHHGVDRDKTKIDWQKYDVVVTTYNLIALDISLFSKQEYGYVILDESQAIKNPASKRFKAVSVLKAKNRLALTGTPIENNTFDLYAQMSFVNPGLFISAESFRTEYSLPIDKNGDQVAAAELNKIIHPFMLRRTKEMVATELPPKTEDVIYCNMDVAQRKVYDAHRNEYRNNILNLIEENGLQKSKLHVLQALTKLRQVCNSPALLSGEESYDGDSVKIRELVRHIQEKTGNHKLLIFSQFVKMLGLIRTELDRLDINYSYLDGQTSQKNRKMAVDDFQENDKTRVFLISLKAGGLGLNLTAADYVYIVDPWWNPAVENQAIDRCYRIGQDKKVIAYRMICKDTLEEKIMNYKSRKQAVADAIIQTDENVMKQISKEDIMDLLG